MDILKKALSYIKPRDEEEKKVVKRIDIFLKKINSGLKDAKAQLYGSGAKGTWLKGEFDADIFVKFDYDKYKDRSEGISEELKKHLNKRKIKFEVLHGSRDYYRADEDDFVYEIIPILDIKKADEAKNITDISPLHAKWVNANASKKIVDDIRLAKAFLKANNLYGAESYIRGFSGYVTEILIIYYKGFLNFLKAAAKWKDKEIIDIKKHHKNALMMMNKSKLDSPIIVVDPVDKTRNAAAALSYEKAEKLRKIAAEFLKKKSIRFFEKEKIDEEKLKEKSKGKKLIIIDVMPMAGKDDVVGAKIMKSYEFIVKRLKEKDFDISESGWEWDKAKKAMIWTIIKGDLERYKEHEGPKKEMKQHCEIFKKKYKNSYAKDGRLFAKVEREFLKAEDYLNVLLKDEWFIDKAEFKNIRVL